MEDSFLPIGYRRIPNEPYYDYKKFRVPAIGCVIALFVILYLLTVTHSLNFELSLNSIAKFLFNNSATQFPHVMISILVFTTGLIIICYLTLLLHELIHYLADWVFTQKKSFFHVTKAMWYVELPQGVFESKWGYFVSLIAPVTLITILGLVVTIILPLSLVPFGIIVTMGNLGASLSDIFQSYWVLIHPRTAKFGVFDKRTFAIIPDRD